MLCTPQGKSWEPRGAGSCEDRGGVDTWRWPVRSQGPSPPGRWHPHVLPGGGGCLAQGRAHTRPEQERPLPSFGGLGTHTAASGFRGTRRQTSPCFLNRTASPDCDLFPDGQASGRHRGWPAAPLRAPPQGWALLPRVRPRPRAICSRTSVVSVCPSVRSSWHSFALTCQPWSKGLGRGLQGWAGRQHPEASEILCGFLHF